MNISNSLKTLLYNLIDYAGLFPPAGLKLETAIKNYLNYLNTEYDFALSKFIMPVSRLEEASGILKKSDLPDHPLELSVIPSSGKNLNEFKDNIQMDIVTCKKFIEEFSGVVNMNSFEVKLPEVLFNTDVKDSYYDLISYINDDLNNISDQGSIIFYEGIMNSEWKRNTENVIDSVNRNNLNNSKAGFKLRTGGLSPEAFPGSHQIAFCIRNSLDRNVPMKFTAGLHHPFRHFDKSIGTKMHGFVNVFGSGITAMRHDINDEGITEMLEDENPENFKFTGESFSWKGWESEIDDIVFARRDLVLSYGSCSFDEPIDDLRSLNLIN